MTNIQGYSFEWQTAYPALVGLAKFKTDADDFYVEEVLGFELTGSGEHYFLFVEKRQLNTTYVAEKLANWARVSPKNISYAGLKDRQAVTRQWFSIWLPGKSLPDELPDIPGVKVLTIDKNNRKLKRGALKYNQFKIILRDSTFNEKDLKARMELIRSLGVPNYFGQQRFGIDGNNINNAANIFAKKRIKRTEKSIVLSALRSYLFNSVLSMLVSNNSWRSVLENQALQLVGSKSWFIAKGQKEEEIRVESGDCSPTCSLYADQNDNQEIPLLPEETMVVNKYSELTAILDKSRLERSRRATILRPIDLSYRIESQDIELSFALLPGSYATSIIREIIGEM